MSSSTPSVGIRASVIVGLVALAAAVGAIVGGQNDDAEQRERERQQQLTDYIVCLESDMC